MKGKINIKKSLIAYLLVIAMVLTMIPVGNQALAAESTTNLGTASINFSSTNGEGDFYFKGCLTSGFFLTDGKYYKGRATIGTDAGTEERNVTLGIGSNGQISIYKGFFTFANNPTSLVPTASFEIKEGTQFTEVWPDPWSEEKEGETPTTFTVARGLRIKKVGETWEQEISNTLSLSYKSGSIVENTSICYTGTTNAGDGKIASTVNVPNHDKTARYYKVLATLENENGSYDQEIALSLSSDDGVTLDTWYAAGFYKVNDNSNTIFPTKSLTIQKDAVFTEMYHNGTSFQEVPGGYRYILGEEFKIVKNDDGSWSEPQEEQETLTLSYKEGDPTTNEKFVFTASTETGEVKHTKDTGTYYKVTAKINGSDVKEVVLGLDDTDRTKFTIWGKSGSYYDCNNNGNTVYPTTSFEIAKDAVFTEMYHDGSMFLEIENGNQYCVAERLYIENYNGTWRAPYDEVKLTFNKATKYPVLYFTNALDDGKTLTDGTFYKVQTKVDGSDRTVVFAIGTNGQATIWSNFYSASPGDSLSTQTPKESFVVEKGAEFIEINFSTKQEVEGAKRYQLAETISLENIHGWRDTAIDMSTVHIDGMTGIYVDEQNNFRFDVVMPQYTEALKSQWYRTKILVDGSEKDVLLQLTGETSLYIYYHTFSCPPDSENYVVPLNSVKFEKGTVLTPVNMGVNNDWWTVDKDSSFLCIDNTCTFNKTDDGWKLNVTEGDANGDGVFNVRDLVRCLRYEHDNSSVVIYPGGDVNNDGTYEDSDLLRSLLIGVTPLVSQSVSSYQIVVPASATSNETVAANELQYFVKEATGATLPVVSETADMEATKGNYLYVGETNAAKEVNVASQTQKKTGFI